MELLRLDWPRKHLLLGIVSSATSGTEDICRAASNAFVSFMQLLESDSRKEMMRATSAIILERLHTSAAQDDRVVVPILDFLCFTMDQGVFTSDLITSPGQNTWDIWAIMLKVHNTSSSLQRVEASLNLYSRLLEIDRCRAHATDKMTRQLLHRWPKVRFLLLGNRILDLTFYRFVTRPLTCCIWILLVRYWHPATGTAQWPKSSQLYLNSGNNWVLPGALPTSQDDNVAKPPRTRTCSRNQYMLSWI